MRLIKRIVLLLAGLALVLVLAFWGFMQNFPGKSIADAASVRLSSHTGIPFEIEDLELGWSKLSTPEIAMSTPKWLAGIPDLRLLILENVEVPFASIITSGEARMRGQLHDGTMRLSTELFNPELLDLSLDRVKLERIPLFALVPYAFISGSLSMSAHINNIRALQQQAPFPSGSLSGNLHNTRIRISEGAALLDLQFPELNFSEILFELELGPIISIKKMQLKGSLEGNVDGTIRLNENQPNLSLIDLNFRLTPSSLFKKEISRYSTFLSSFQCGETININLKGTFNRFSFPTRNQC